MKIFLLEIFKYLLMFFYIFPVKPSSIFYMSFEGAAFSCNPKYIYNYLLDYNFKSIWVINSKNISIELLNDNVTIVKYKSLKYYYYMLTAKIILTNNISISYIPFRKKQTVIGTWHGGGAYKKVGLNIDNSDKQRKFLQSLSNNMDFMVSSCQKFSDVMNEAYLIKKEKFIDSGMPRNDILINKDVILKKQINRKIREKYNIDENKKIVLYAPTFRGNLNAPVLELRNIYNLNISKLKKALENKFSGEFTVLFRAHYYLSSLDLFDEVIDVSNYPDMQELLLISDVLINDYSSSMWDFSFTNKPCFIYASDKKEYANDRDFYTPMRNWPFSIAATNDELEKNILNFNESEYIEKIKKHHQNLGSFEKGAASKIIGNKIIGIQEEL